MIDPQPGDEGRAVVYRTSTGAEVGVVYDWNDSFVFVRYGRDLGSKATVRGDLEWYRNS